MIAKLGKVFQSKYYDLVWLIIFYLILVFVGIGSWPFVDGAKFDLFSFIVWLSVILGSAIGAFGVLSFANRLGWIGSIIAIIGSLLDAFNNLVMGLLANTIYSISVILICILGLVTYSKNKKEKIQVGKMQKSNFIISIVLGVLGVLILVVPLKPTGTGLIPLGIELLPVDVFTQTASVAFWLGCGFILCFIAFIFKIVGLYLVISGRSISWPIYIVVNALNISYFAIFFYILGTSTYLIYMIFCIMLLLNSVKGTVVWKLAESEPLEIEPV